VYTFLKLERLVVGLWRWHLFLVFILCTAEFVWNFSLCFTVEFINEMVYSYGKLKLLNRSVHEFLGFASPNTSTVYMEQPVKIPLLWNIKVKRHNENHNCYKISEHTILFVSYLWNMLFFWGGLQPLVWNH